MFLLNFVFSYFKTKIPPKKIVEEYNINDVDDGFSILDKKFTIPKEQIGKIFLKPTVIPPKKEPETIASLIAGIKLRPTPSLNKTSFYTPRHPVLQELMENRKVRHIT